MLNAVSPAVVVPTCVYLQQNRIGTAKGIPTLILASASFDDVVAIAGFSVFLAVIFSTDGEFPATVRSIRIIQHIEDLSYSRQLKTAHDMHDFNSIARMDNPEGSHFRLDWAGLWPGRGEVLLVSSRCEFLPSNIRRPLH